MSPCDGSHVTPWKEFPQAGVRVSGDLSVRCLAEFPEHINILYDVRLQANINWQ
jgi:hypothetical protein